MNISVIAYSLFHRAVHATLLLVGLLILMPSGEGRAQEGAGEKAPQKTEEAKKSPVASPSETKAGKQEDVAETKTQKSDAVKNSDGETAVQKKDAESTRVEKTGREPVTHEFKGIRATGDVVRGVLAGGAVLLELNQPLPRDSKPVIELDPVQDTDSATAKSRPKKTAPMEIQGYPDGNIVATVPRKTEPGLYRVNLKLSGEQVVEIQRPQLLKVQGIAWIISLAFLPLILLALILWLLLRLYRRAQTIQRRSILALLFLEPENQTYSLSRAQFIVWSIAIVWAYVFIFVARGIVENIWTFPPLEGFGMTFLISLGTLITAQATSAAKGAKGAGQFQPSPADLVLHGGVLALERVQQVLWTLTAVGMFVVIVYKQYAIATELPVIPEELLILMGISSAGYLGGKFARKAGPIIDQVRAAVGSVVLTIQGKQLSKEALVWVDGTRLEDKPSVLLSDPDRNEFARELQMRLTTTNLETWLSQERSVVVVNTDGQRAEWQSDPMIETAILQPAQDNKVEILVTGSYLGDGTTWEVTGATVTEAPKRDTANLRQWHIPATLALPVPDARGKITAQTARGRRTTADWPSK